jgi:hypothetical protein
MTLPDLYPRHKVPDEVRECMGCHIKVMGRGDQSGWKGVDGGGGNLHWYCDKPACQGARDEFIQKRQVEMIQEGEIARRVAQSPAVRPVEELDDAEAATEEERLKTRLLALKVRREKKAEGGQSTAEPVPVLGVDAQEGEDEAIVREMAEGAAPEPEPSPEEDKAAVDSKFAGVVIHQTQDGIESVCGEEGAMFAPGEDLPPNCVPCVTCAEILEENGPQPKEAEPTVGVVNPDAGKVGQVPVSEAKPAPEKVVDFDQLPRFTPELIQTIHEWYVEGAQVLIPPQAYPDMDLAQVDLARIRKGVTAMFKDAKLEIDTLRRARKGDEFVGLVFTLKKV